MLHFPYWRSTLEEVNELVYFANAFISISRKHLKSQAIFIVTTQFKGSTNFTLQQCIIYERLESICVLFNQVAFITYSLAALDCAVELKWAMRIVSISLQLPAPFQMNTIFWKHYFFFPFSLSWIVKFFSEIKPLFLSLLTNSKLFDK